MDNGSHPVVERLRRREGARVFDLLSSGLPGADLTAALLDVMQTRADARSPAEVLHQRERDRFVGPAAVDGRQMMDVEHRAVISLPPDIDVVTLAPLVPLGTHSVIAGVSQHRVVSTVRSTEVAADPTNALALEAALRRRVSLRAEPRSSEIVRLAAVQRVTRAQRFEGPLSFAHLSLLGLVVAGRDSGSSSFERASLPRLVQDMVAVVRAAGGDDVETTVTDLDGRFGTLAAEVVTDIASRGFEARVDTARTAGRGYYPALCFKMYARVGQDHVEVGDGGFVPWTQRLLSNAKERLLIGGIGLDRLALVPR